MDRTTEAIAHFIGYFSVVINQIWQRDAFLGFTPPQLHSVPPSQLPTFETTFSADHWLDDYEPGYLYRPVLPTIVKQSVVWSVDYDPPDVHIKGMVPGAPRFSPDASLPQAGSYQPSTVEIPGSVAIYINQDINLSDNDYFSVGGHWRFSPPPANDAALISMFNRSDDLALFRATDVPGNAAELRKFATDAVSAIASFDPVAAQDETLFVASAPTLGGSFVNGEKGDEPEDLEDHFDFDERIDAGSDLETPLATNATITAKGWRVDVSVEINAGGNTLINNAVLKNTWAGAKVTAVMGDHVEINAITQTNAWSDSDIIAAALVGWDGDAEATKAFNVATYSRHDPSAEDPADEQESLAFPKHWAVEEVSGDLLIVNWLQQFTFMSDNDVGIASSSGVTTAVHAGGNISYNDVFIKELGYAYDLIIVGGGWFDLNIIQQANILLDDDAIWALAGFETTGAAGYSTSGNLLWNQAHIYNVGQTDTAQPMPGGYRDLASALAAEQKEISNDVLSDASFGGLGALRVLYIRGDLINVQYADMVNVLGDRDQIAVAMDGLDAHPEAKWSLNTGNNVLINSASILDVDSLGKTYVSGNHYSNDLLVQADIISTEPEFKSWNPNVLINEAVAFLDDDDWDLPSTQHQPGNLDPDNSYGDSPLQALIG